MSTTTSEKIAVMEASARGEAVQCRMRGDVAWRDAPKPVWDWGLFDYRVAPKIVGVVTYAVVKKATGYVLSHHTTKANAELSMKVNGYDESAVIVELSGSFQR